MKKAFVTGGAGFIGSHLVKSLVDNGWQVTVVDDLSGGKIENLAEKVKFRTVPPALTEQFLSSTTLDQDEVLLITGDMVEPAVVYHLQNHGYTHVFHLAANPRVEFSVQYPATSTETNVQKTVELMSACKAIGLKRFIFASSSAVYGEAKSLPTPENEPKNPRSPYGLHKLVGEQFMQLFSELYEMDFVALRFGNVYGPGSDGASPYSTAIGAWCNKLKNGQPLRSDGDGEQSRDMIYVSDVAEGLRLCAEREQNFVFSAMNLGTCTSVTNNQILQMLQDLVENFEIQQAPVRPGDVRHTLLDIVKVANETGWKANITLEEGLRRTLEWWGIPLRK